MGQNPILSSIYFFAEEHKTAQTILIILFVCVKGIMIGQLSSHYGLNQVVEGKNVLCGSILIREYSSFKSITSLGSFVSPTYILR